MAKRDADQASVDAKRATGLVNYKGKWMYPREREALVAEERAAATKAAANRSTTGWITDYDLALSLAKAQNKQVLLNFTGSDWCGWCIKLDKEVFSQKAFLEYARDHYILVKLDFPRRSKLPDNLIRQNETLAKQYKVRGFPTVVVLNTNGKKHKTGGYVRGGPNAFIQSLQ